MSEATKPDPKQVYRLHDMSVEEVSVVDRAANRRKFLLVKSEDGMGIGAPVTQDANGNLTAAKPAPTETAPPAGGDTANTETAKGLDADAKAAFVSVVESALEGLSKAKQLLAASGDAGQVVDAVVKVADDLADSVFAYLGIEGDGDNAGLTKPSDEPAPPAGMGKRLEVRRAKRVIAKDASDQARTTLLAKVGAKMSKDRLDRFQQAYAVFGELLAEVLPKVDTDKAKGEMSAGVAEQKPGEKPATQPSVPEKKQRKTVDPEVQKALDAAAATIKKQAEQLQQLRDARQPSNGASVEVQKARGEEVSWPLDMNEPVNEKTSGKDFFG